METPPEAVDDAPFDPMTQMVIRKHQREAAKRPASEMMPIAQTLVTMRMSPTTSEDAALRWAGGLLVKDVTPTRTSPITSADAAVRDPVCERCDGAGYYKEAVSVGHPRFGQIFPCECKLAERSARRRREVDQHLARLAGGLGNLAGKRLADFDLDRPLDPSVEWCGITADRDQQRKGLERGLSDAQRYLENPAGGLFICGPTGAGKSLLAAGVINALVERDVQAGYESAPALLRHIQSGFKDHTADDRLDALLDVELLLIDDLGTEHKGGWNEQTLFEILDTRYKQSRRTLITANIRRKDLSRRLSSRIADMVGAEIWLVVSDIREIRLRLRQRQRESAA
jgi:DNA replication protein DnaC